MASAPVAAPPASETLPGPIRVVRVDVDEPLPDVSPFREAGPDYVAAWVVVVRGGRPLGHVEVDLSGGVMGGAELRERLVAGLGDVFSAAVAGGLSVEDRLLPSVTVVVASTFERVELLERCVASLAGQDYPDFEVVVVDNRPTDSPRRRALWSRLSVDGRVRVVAEARRGISAARNHGARVARGEVVAFTDDDVQVESGWLRALGSRYAVEPETDCVTGLVLPRELETPAQNWFERSGSKLEQRYLPTRFGGDDSLRSRPLGRRRFEVAARRDGEPEEAVPIYRGKFGMGANISLRVAAFHALGGFDEALGAGTPSGGGEDIHLLSRLVFEGRRLTFDPGVAIYHVHRREYDELVHQLTAYGSGYTAMLTALIRRDPRHLIGLFWYSVHAVALMRRRSADRHDVVYPKALARCELRGLIRGPWTYLVGRRLTRRLAVAEVRAPVPERV